MANRNRSIVEAWGMRERKGQHESRLDASKKMELLFGSTGGKPLINSLPILACFLNIAVSLDVVDGPCLHVAAARLACPGRAFSPSVGSRRMF